VSSTRFGGGWCLGKKWNSEGEGKGLGMSRTL
jgi:hypothetical protein